MNPGAAIVTRRLADMEAEIAGLQTAPGDPLEAVSALLRLGEEILEHWVTARGQTPTTGEREGFRILALHRQGAQGDPTFNACRESVRELVYHYNLVAAEPNHVEAARRVRLASAVAMHLYLFVTGKMQVAGLGEFCCSSRPLRSAGA